MSSPQEHLVHLMSDDLLDACETAVHGSGLHLAPHTTPDAITCPECRPLIEPERRRVLERDHADALEENAAHDAAMQNAQNLTPELLAHLTRPWSERQPPRHLPRAMRYGAGLRLVIPQ